MNVHAIWIVTLTSCITFCKAINRDCKIECGKDNFLNKDSCLCEPCSKIKDICANPTTPYLVYKCQKHNDSFDCPHLFRGSTDNSVTKGETTNTPDLNINFSSTTVASSVGNGSFSSVATAGITIAALFVVGLAILVGFYCFKKRCNAEKKPKNEQAESLPLTEIISGPQPNPTPPNAEQSSLLQVENSSSENLRALDEPGDNTLGDSDASRRFQISPVDADSRLRQTSDGQHLVSINVDVHEQPPQPGDASGHGNNSEAAEGLLDNENDAENSDSRRTSSSRSASSPEMPDFNHRRNGHVSPTGANSATLNGALSANCSEANANRSSPANSGNSSSDRLYSSEEMIARTVSGMGTRQAQFVNSRIQSTSSLNHFSEEPRSIALNMQRSESRDILPNVLAEQTTLQFVSQTGREASPPEPPQF